MGTNPELFEESAIDTVDLARRIRLSYPDGDNWAIADGVIAGAIHYWLESRTPCEDPMCEDCAVNSTTQMRLAELLKLVERIGRKSEHLATANDRHVGRA